MKWKTGKQQRKLMKQGAGFQGKKISKIDKPLARLIMIEREKTKLTNIRNETGDITVDPAENTTQKFVHINKF